MDMMMGKRTVECFSKIFEFSDRREEAAETVVPDTMQWLRVAAVPSRWLARCIFTAS